MNRRYRKTIIAGNWKMNKTPAEAKALIEEMKPLLSKTKWCEMVLCVPFTDIQAAVKAAKGSKIAIGAENMHFEKSGAFTGEISADMLKELGVKYVIIGHSERRQYFAETDETVNKRTKAAFHRERTNCGSVKLNSTACSAGRSNLADDVERKVFSKHAGLEVTLHMHAHVLHFLREQRLGCHHVLNFTRSDTEGNCCASAMGARVRVTANDSHIDSAIIVTADHETGGLKYKDGETKDDIKNSLYTTKTHTDTNVKYFIFVKRLSQDELKAIIPEKIDNTDVNRIARALLAA